MEFQIKKAGQKIPDIKGKKIQLGIEKSRFAGTKKVIPKTTLGLRSKKLPLKSEVAIASLFCQTKQPKTFKLQVKTITN